MSLCSAAVECGDADESEDPVESLHGKDQAAQDHLKTKDVRLREKNE